MNSNNRYHPIRASSFRALERSSNKISKKVGQRPIGCRVGRDPRIIDLCRTLPPTWDVDKAFGCDEEIIGNMSEMKRILTPLLAVDAVIFYAGGIVLIQRDNPPFAGSYALPGGFVEIGETVEAAAVREAREETGLDIELLGLVGIYSDPARDPRGHVVSIVFLAQGKGDLLAGSDARAAQIFSLHSLPELAFDHGKIISDALALDNQIKVE